MSARTPLFSTYKQGENRVTASMLAVFQRIDPSDLTELLAAASEQPELSFVEFRSQPAGPASVPDAEISASFHYLFEVKTVPNGVGVQQLHNHTAHFKEVAHKQLFVITPDAAEPSAVTGLGDPRVVWVSFRAVSQAIDALIDSQELLSGQARFLLRELQALFQEEGLLEDFDTVVVAARFAFGEYLTHHAYICQAGRPFRKGLRRLGFYTAGEIKREVPAIVRREDHVLFSPEEIARRRENGGEGDAAIADVIESALDGERRVAGEHYQVFVLSPDASPATLLLDAPIKNVKLSKAGKPWAWTLGQRYVDSSQLKDAKTTDDL